MSQKRENKTELASRNHSSEKYYIPGSRRDSEPTERKMKEAKRNKKSK